jgi:hypothetical protein
LTDTTSEAIERMKDSLDELALAYMHCVPVPKRLDPKRISRDLLDAISLASGRPGHDSAGRYGSELRFEVRVTPDQRRLVSITATFDIECASDTILHIFAPTRSQWVEVVRWQSAPYKEVSGAFSMFQYGISSPDRGGSWYVVTAYIDGWCSSTWSMINFAVLRPASISLKPRVLLASSDSIWWGNEDFGKLVVNQLNFDLRFHAESLDLGVHNRVYIRRYAVNGDVVKRVQPVAASPRDFVDEWTVSPWPEAANWSNDRNIGELKQMHDELQRLKSDPDTGFSYESVHECTGSGYNFQVELCRDNGPSFYFYVKGHSSFAMVRVRNTPDPLCAGKNVLDRMETR